ncbi:MAG: D-alanine--D-alanine ligase [Pseudomonadota bacterium]
MSNFHDPLKFGKVAVLMGGDSAEREVSLASGKEVLDALMSAGVDAHAFDTSEKKIYELVTGGFDRVFNILHGRGGEDGVVQGALEQLDIPYTGTGVLGSALAMDKVLTKTVWSAHGLPTANYRVFSKTTFIPEKASEVLSSLGGTVFVKPSREGSSIGMSKASTPDELVTAVKNAFDFDCDVLVETFIDGPEFTVAILADKALPSIRMSSSHEFYDYDAKYKSDDTQYFCPSGLTKEEESELAALAFNAFCVLTGKGWGRVDVMRNQNREFVLLESNTIPGMTAKSLVPKAAKQAGMSFPELVLTILAQSLGAQSER